jgi:hypothetical protein
LLRKRTALVGVSANRDTRLLFELVVLVIGSAGEDLIFSVCLFGQKDAWDQNNPEI